MADNGKEWSAAKKWNPFNSYKLLAQVYRWKQIEEGRDIPQPALVTVDPINVCDLKCEWCNANAILNKNKTMISESNLIKIADFLKEWKGSPKWEKGVEAVCIAGGGEPLLHPSIDKFIERLVENGIEVGVVTNGTQIHKYLEALSKCTWVGVSVDSGNKQGYKKTKKVDCFQKVLENIKLLVDYSIKNKTTLAMDRQGYGVSYKYLLTPKNVGEIYEAAKYAKDIGCKNFHMRPAGVPWSEIGYKKRNIFNFDNRDVDVFNEQTLKARELEDDQFGVFGITHKFDNKFDKSNAFNSCHAIFMTGVFMPATNGDKNAFDFGLCCDRRGDDLLLLEKGINDVKIIEKSWGSKKHWDIYKKIKVDKCPRCTYQPHNQIYEHVIEEDSMTYKFI